MAKSLDLFASRVYRKSRSQSSVGLYVYAVEAFTGFMGFNDPDELISRVSNGEVNVAEALNRWLDKLDGEEKSPQTQINYYAGVKKFVETCLPDHRVNWKRVDLPRLWRVEEDRLPTREEIRKILSHGTLLDRVIVTFMVSSGARENTMVNLKVGDVDLNSYEDVGIINVRPEAAKERVRYVGFISPEAKKILRQYLSFRERKGEKITPESPLIKGKSGTLKEDGLRQRWRRLLKKTGLDEKTRTFHKLRMHTLRKYFRTNLELAGVSKSFRERLMGHKGEYLDSSYFKPVLEQLLNEYRKAIPNLTLLEEVKYEEMRKRQLVDTARLMGFDEEKLKKLEDVLARARTTDEAIEEFKKFREEEAEVPEEERLRHLGDVQTNGNGFRARIIDEEELIGYVEQGWEPLKELSGGRYLIRIISL